jgi:hypothetical protein
VHQEPDRVVLPVGVDVDRAVVRVVRHKLQADLHEVARLHGSVDPQAPHPRRRHVEPHGRSTGAEELGEEEIDLSIEIREHKVERDVDVV